MSDVGIETPVAAPVAPAPTAPAPTPVAAPVAPVAEAPKVPTTKREARAQVNANLRAQAQEGARQAAARVAAAQDAPAPVAPATPEPVASAPVAEPAQPAVPEPIVDATGRKHAPAGTPEAGQFLPGEVEPVDEPTPEPVPEAPKGVQVRLDKHRGHPALEGIKAEALTVGSEEEAKLVQALLNGTYARRNEADALREQIRERDQALLEAQQRIAQIEAGQAATEKWQRTPEYQRAVEKFETIRDTVGQEEASAFWRGIQGDLRQMVDSEYQTRATAIQAEHQARDGQRWEAETRLFVEDKVPDRIRMLPDYGRWYAEELDTFEIKIERGHYPDLARLPVNERSQAMRQAFLAQLNARLGGENSVRALARQTLDDRRKADLEARAKAAQDTKARAEAERKKAAQEAVDGFKKEAADKRVASPPHPMGSLAASARPSPNGTAAPEPEDLSKLTQNDLRSRGRQAARQAAARHFGP